MQLQQILVCACFWVYVFKGAEVSGAEVRTRLPPRKWEIAEIYAIQNGGLLSDLSLNGFLRIRKLQYPEQVREFLTVDLSEISLEKIQECHALNRKIAITDILYVSAKNYGFILLSRMDFSQNELAELKLSVETEETMNEIIRQTAAGARTPVEFKSIYRGGVCSSFILEEYAVSVLPKLDLMQLYGILRISIKNPEVVYPRTLGEIENGSIEIQNEANLDLDDYAVLYLPKFNLARMTEAEPFGFSGRIDISLSDGKDRRFDLFDQIPKGSISIGNAENIVLTGNATRYATRFNLTRHIFDWTYSTEKRTIYNSKRLSS